jgi:hypothetical protein
MEMKKRAQDSGCMGTINVLLKNTFILSFFYNYVYFEISGSSHSELEDQYLFSSENSK